MSFIDTNRDTLLVQAIGSFLGAFFAFMFVKIADFTSSIHKRKLMHYNALINLQAELNDIGAVIHDDLYIIPQFVEVITKGNVYSNNLRMAPYSKEPYSQLFNLDLINDLNTFHSQLRKINDDIETINSGYNELKQALIQRNLSLEDYKINMENISTNLKLLEVFMTEFQQSNNYMFAKVRVLSDRDRPITAKLQNILLWELSRKLNTTKVEKEKIKIEKEIEETKSLSRKEIEEIIKKYSVPIK